jgi:hypothetical protein
MKTVVDIDKTLIDGYELQNARYPRWRDAHARRADFSVTIGGTQRSNGYFFLEDEFGKKNRQNYYVMNRDRLVRHMFMLTNGKYFDYIVRKEFNTFEEWMKDCGATSRVVRYGRFDVQNDYYVERSWNVTLDDLIKMLGPKTKEIEDDIPFKLSLGSDVEEKLKSKGLSFRNLYVANMSAVTSLVSFMTG